jgi:hypothetical protein
MKTYEDPKIVEKLQRSKRIYQGTWEHGSVYLFDSIRAYEDLASVLMSMDANDLIVSMRDITPLVAGDLTGVQRKDLTERLTRHLQDARMCDIEYAGFHEDDEDATTVSQAAACALDCLKKLD